MAQLADRITVNPDQCGGRPCIRGLRIRVSDVLDLLAAGLSAEKVIEELPDLELEDVSASPGGRIFERTTGGTEHDWGEVTIWEPPTRLGYLWHLRRDRADATEVEIQFIDRGDATTRVEIEHRGWEALGADGESWRDRNHGGWATLLPHFVAAATPGS